MSSESLHAPRERLSPGTLNFHHAIVSLIEELEAIDWYRQRADDTADESLKGLLLHNMREEMEHASMLLEWLRRVDRDFESFLRLYLFREGAILDIEEGGGLSEDTARGDGGSGLTIGSLREE